MSEIVDVTQTVKPEISMSGFIRNANCAEDLNQRLMSSPLGLFYAFDVRALSDYGKFMYRVAENFEKQHRWGGLASFTERRLPTGSVLHLTAQTLASDFLHDGESAVIAEQERRADDAPLAMGSRIDKLAQCWFKSRPGIALTA